MTRHSVLWPAAWCAMLLAAAGAAQGQGQEKPAVSVTVYNQGYAVVKDDRLVDIKANEDTLRMREVAQHIDPTSVYFQSLTDPSGTAVLEQNYEFDLVSADKLLQKYLDKDITVTTKSEKFSGLLQSFDAGQIVLKNDKGILMVQRPENVVDIAFGSLPEGLLTKPTLVWTVAARKTGQHLVRLAYQTTQMNWRADYNVVTNEDDTRADVGGWVTVTNNSGATYKNAHLKLMAGDVRRVEEPVYLARKALAEYDKGQNAGGAMPEEKAFFEYHMYTFERLTTLADRQVKQLQLLQAADVGLEKIYLYQGQQTPYWGGIQKDRAWGDSGNKKVKVILEIANTGANHLGKPLPAGKVRVFKKDKADNSLEFIGEDKIDHTKATDKVKLYVGNAFDLNGERKVMDFQLDEGRRMMTEKIQITLTSAKLEPVKIKVEEKLSRAKSWQITEQSDDFTKEDAFTVTFVVPVDARRGDRPGKKVITYTVQYTW